VQVMGKWVLTGFDNDKKGERFSMVVCGLQCCTAAWCKSCNTKEHLYT
jgi:hypothetical protein